MSFSVEPGQAAYVPFGHDYPGAPEQLAREVVLEKLRPILESERPAKIGQNFKYDMSVLARAGITLAGAAFDTMLESYVLDSTATRHDMDSLALKYLGHRTIHYEDVAGKGAKQLSFNEGPGRNRGPVRGRGRRRDVTAPPGAAPAARSACVPCDAVRHDRDPARAGPLAHGAQRGANRCRAAESAERRARAADARDRGVRPRLRRRAVQPRVREADPGHPLRQSRAAGARQDPQGPAVHGGVGVAGACLRARSAEAHPRPPGDEQAEIDVHRRPACHA